MEWSNQLSQAVQGGNAPDVKAFVQEAIDRGEDINAILDAMLAGMTVVGQKFKKNEIFVPEVLIAARALNGGLDMVKPLLMESGVKPKGKAVIGTVEGDLHDIGKNLVKMMLVGAGLDIIDVGVDVPPERFVDEALAHDVDVVCVSALLTTTMDKMRDVVSTFEARGVRDRVKIMVGGAPVNASFAEKIGADYYAPDAASAAEIVTALFAKT